MSRLSCLVLFFVALFFVQKSVAQERTYIFNNQNSVIRWKGYNIYKSESTSHYGIIKIKSGHLRVNSKKELTDAMITVDMKSIENIDLASDPNDRKNLESHLKSQDFFDVNSYPEAVIQVNSQKPTGKTNEYIFSGKMKIKFTELPITFVGILKFTGQDVEWIIDEMIINRQDYKVRMDNSVKDKLILDEIDLQVYLTSK